MPSPSSLGFAAADAAAASSCAEVVWFLLRHGALPSTRKTTSRDALVELYDEESPRAHVDSLAPDATFWRRLAGADDLLNGNFLRRVDAALQAKLALA